MPTRSCPVRRLAITVLGAGLLVASPLAPGAPIDILTGAQILLDAGNPGGGSSAVDTRAVSIPEFGSLFASAASGPERATVQVLTQDLGNLATMDFDFTLERGVGAGTLARARPDFAQPFHFRALTAVDYVAGGSVSLVGGGIVYLDLQLIDVTGGGFVEVLRSAQRSASTPNETLILGESGGDIFNRNRGSLSGTLPAGHLYELRPTVEIGSGGFFGDAATSATGTLSLSFTEAASASPVPGPGTLAICLAGLVVALGRRRGRHMSPRSAREVHCAPTTM